MDFPKEQVQSLWAPWRVEYFGLEKDRDFLIEAAQASDDRVHLVVARRKSSFLMMNRFPYAVGHMMAVPYQKIGDMDDLGDAQKVELWNLATHAQRLLRKVAGAQGFNVGINLGTCAGAGVADHLHVHIVPRWEGDNNFMPVLADTRVMPQALEALYDKLVAAQLEQESNGWV